MKRSPLPDRWARCSTCLGHGELRAGLGEPAQPCPACHGLGEVPMDAKALREEQKRLDHAAIGRDKS